VGNSEQLRGCKLARVKPKRPANRPLQSAGRRFESRRGRSSTPNLVSRSVSVHRFCTGFRAVDHLRRDLDGSATSLEWAGTIPFQESRRRSGPLSVISDGRGGRRVAIARATRRARACTKRWGARSTSRGPGMRAAHVDALVRGESCRAESSRRRRCPSNGPSS
jgi:hypothetical protein